MKNIKPSISLIACLCLLIIISGCGPALHRATRSGDLNSVKNLIQEGNVADTRDNLNRTALMIAAHNGDFEICKYLVENGADVNSMGGKNLATPLLGAIVPGNVEIANFLIDHGADVNQYNRQGYSPLIAAIAAQKFDLAFISKLIDAGADVNACTNGSTGNNLTPLIAAVNKLEFVKLLLKNGANVNQQTPYGMTALMYASMVGNVDIVNYLIDKGANIFLSGNVNGDEWSALSCAAGAGKVEIVKILIKNGALNNKIQKVMAREAAIKYGRTEVVPLLSN